MFIRMDREKMVGENLRDGSMEVAFELWIEQNDFFLVDSNGISHRYLGKQYRNQCMSSRIVMRADLFLNLGGTTDTLVRPKHKLRAIFLSVLSLLFTGGIYNG